MSDFFVLRREATGQPFVTEIDGNKLTIPHTESLDQFELAELIASNPSDLQFVTRLFALAMGDGVKELRAARLTQKELMALFDAYKKHCGTDEGESAASSD